MTEQTDTPNPEAVELQPGTPEYDAAMVQKFEEANSVGQADEQTEQPDTQEQRPAWLPEKFKTPEDLAKAYAELEKKLSSGGAKENESPASDTPTQEQAKAAVEAAGLDFEGMAARFAKNGELSEEDYKALEAAKIPKSLVDAYIEGQMAIARSNRAALLAGVGGEEGFASMSEWAAANLPAEEIEAFNAVMDGGDMGAMKLALAGLKAQYDAANGAEPTLLSGQTGADTADVFRSTAELVSAMKDPRYEKDPAYRADVERKLARSNLVF